MTFTLLLPLLLLTSVQEQDPPPQAPDPVQSYWERVADDLAEKRSVRQVLTLSPRTEELSELVRSTHVPSFAVENEESLKSLTESLQTLTGIPILVDMEAEESILDEGLTFSLNLTQHYNLEALLDLICEMSGHCIDWTIREGAVLFTTPDRALDPEIYLHLIADLTHVFEADYLAHMVMENVSVGSWERDGVTLEITGPFLTVTHDRSVQILIEDFFADLRVFTDTLKEAPDPSRRPWGDSLQSDLERLESVRLAPSFSNAPIGTVAAFLQELTGLHFVVSREVREELDEEETQVSLTLPQTDVRTILNLIVQLRPQLAWSVADGIVRIQTSDECRPGAVLAFYDVRTIVSPAPPECVLHGDFERGDEVHEVLIMGEDYLDSLIRNSIAPESWDRNPQNTMRITNTGILIVNQTPTVQEEIRKLLGDLQAIAEIMLTDE